MNNDMLTNIRLNLALKMGDSKTVAELEELLKWIVGPQSTIIPATKFEVKQ